MKTINNWTKKETGTIIRALGRENNALLNSYHLNNLNSLNRARSHVASLKSVESCQMFEENPKKQEELLEEHRELIDKLHPILDTDELFQDCAPIAKKIRILESILRTDPEEKRKLAAWDMKTHLMDFGITEYCLDNLNNMYMSLGDKVPPVLDRCSLFQAHSLQDDLYSLSWDEDFSGCLESGQLPEDFEDTVRDALENQVRALTKKLETMADQTDDKKEELEDQLSVLTEALSRLPETCDMLLEMLKAYYQENPALEQDKHFIRLVTLAVKKLGVSLSKEFYDKTIKPETLSELKMLRHTLHLASVADYLNAVHIEDNQRYGSYSPYYAHKTPSIWHIFEDGKEDFKTDAKKFKTILNDNDPSYFQTLLHAVQHARSSLRMPPFRFLETPEFQTYLNQTEAELEEIEEQWVDFYNQYRQFILDRLSKLSQKSTAMC